jgi:hypothetical protein
MEVRELDEGAQNISFNFRYSHLCLTFYKAVQGIYTHWKTPLEIHFMCGGKKKNSIAFLIHDS